jgi:pilus assembly protein FimV
LLRKGEVLRFPDKVEMQRVTTQQAISEVNRQNQQWSADKGNAGAVLKGDSKALQSARVSSSKPEGRLVLSSIDNTSAGTAKSSGVSGTGKSLENELTIAQEEIDRRTQENIEFSERIEQLEAQVETMEKLIEVSNDKLRALQLAAVEKNESNVATETSEIVDVTLQTRGVIDDITDTELPESSDVVEPKSGVIDVIEDNIAYIAGAAVALFLVILLVRLRNKDDDGDFDMIDKEAVIDENKVEREEAINEQFWPSKRTH